MHSAATPFFSPRFLSAPSSVTTIRAPDAPIGWPSAQAPPWTLTISCGSLNSAIAAIVTAANASLTSHRSTSPACQPAFFSAFSIAPAGAVENHAGACAWTAWLTMRATGVRPRARAVDSRISTSAAAPSEMLLALAAVMVPSFLNAGLRVAILSSLALKGCSSNLNTWSPPRALAVTGAISQSKLPSSLACLARTVEAMAKWSWASRVKPYCSTQDSANTPIALPRS